MENLCSDPRYIIFNSAKELSNHFFNRASYFARSISLASGDSFIYPGSNFLIHRKSYSLEFCFCSSYSLFKYTLTIPNLFKRETNRRNSEVIMDFSKFINAVISSPTSTIFSFKVVIISLWLSRNSAIFSYKTGLQSYLWSEWL